MLLFFEDEAELARRIAEAAGMPCAMVNRHRFPDGELKLTLPPSLPAHTAVLRSLHTPNEKIVELLLTARTASSLGASKLTLIAPYLAYMRQDMAFTPGEVVSQSVIGSFLASLFNAVITVDPHLHRISRLDQVIAGRQAIALSGAPVLAAWIAKMYSNPLLIGPDEESAQWVNSAAAMHGFDHAVCSKLRHGDREVQITLPDEEIHGRHVVLIDDVASSGETLAQAARLLHRAGAASIDVAVTHALFAGDALSRIRMAGVERIWSTDCIAHETNVVSIANELAKEILTI